MALVVKNPPANAGVVRDLSPIPGLGRYHGVGNSNPFQYSCLENSMGRGAWRTTVHEATMNWTQLSDWTTTNWIAKLQFPLTWDDSYVLGLYILWLLIVVWKIFHLFHSSQSLKLLGMLLNFGKLSLRCLLLAVVVLIVWVCMCMCSYITQIKRYTIFMNCKIHIVKMTILPMAIYRFNAISIKIPKAFFTELEQIISQFVWNYKKPWIAKEILRKKTGTGGINLPEFRVY